MEKKTKRKPSGAAAMGAGPGRPKGIPNKLTSLLRDAILVAAGDVGEDGKGKGEIIGYCRFLAKEEPRAFATLMGKILPTQIEGTGDKGEVVFRTIYEAAKGA